MDNDPKLDRQHLFSRQELDQLAILIGQMTRQDSDTNSALAGRLMHAPGIGCERDLGMRRVLPEPRPAPQVHPFFSPGNDFGARKIELAAFEAARFDVALRRIDSKWPGACTA